MPRSSPHTKETKRKISRALKGHSHSEQTRRKISQTLKKKGIVPPSRKGEKMPDNAKKKISEANFARREEISKATKEWWCKNKHTRTGENHPLYGTGKTRIYCPLWYSDEFKELIFERDEYKCQNPDCEGTTEILVRHHIDYNKQNCHPSNVITVCQSCNAKANWNRDFWKILYSKILTKKGWL